MVTREEAAQVARLARLEFSDEELEQMAQQLSSILAHMDELQRAGVDAFVDASVVDWTAPLRVDAGTPDALAFPPTELSRHSKDGFFTVPRLAALDQQAEL